MIVRNKKNMYCICVCVRDNNEVDNNNDNHYYIGNNTCWSDSENNELSLCV